MARKIRYYYDEESCTFQEERITPKSILRYVFSLFSIAALIAVSALAIYFFAYDDPKNALLKNQNEDLVNRIETFRKEFTMLENHIDSLQLKDKDLYRSILGTEPIPSGIWEGGKGGEARIHGNNTPGELIEAEQKVDMLDHKVQLQTKSYDVLFDLLNDKEEELRHTPAIRPVHGRIISGFGMRLHPILKYRKPHTGLDLQADKGTPVRASADGEVRFAGTSRGGYGIQVHIVHGNFGFESKYAHLKAVNVRQAQRVKRGDIIGYSGNTGLSKGPHLHYEIVKGGNKINPIDYFYGDLSPEEYVTAREEAKVENTSMD